MAPNGPVGKKDLKANPTHDELKEHFRLAMREHPHLTTTKGPKAWSAVDAGALRKVDGGHENDDELAVSVEYYDGQELVHRSAHVHLKKPRAEVTPELQSF